MTSLGVVHRQSRQLRARAEAIFGVVYNVAEAGEPRLGLSPAEFYLGSRAAALGRVPGNVVGSIFGTINPRAVASAVDAVWRRVDPEELEQSRLELALDVMHRTFDGDDADVEATVAQLRPALEACPIEGHPLFAALLSRPWPQSHFGALWRCCDLIREHRGDAHVNAWRSAGLDAVEINVLTELWRGLKFASVTTSIMAWELTDAEAARDRLRSEGLLDGDGLTEAGRSLRDSIEFNTSRQQSHLIANLGDDVEPLVVRLERWSAPLGAISPWWWKGPLPAEA